MGTSPILSDTSLRDVLVVVPSPRAAFAGGLAAPRAPCARALRRRCRDRGIHGDLETQDPTALRAHRPRPAFVPAESVRSYLSIRLFLVILRASLGRPRFLTDVRPRHSRSSNANRYAPLDDYGRKHREEIAEAVEALVATQSGTVDDEASPGRPVANASLMNLSLIHI